MTDRPIIFSGSMVRSLLAGRKSMTRRILKPQPEQFVTAEGPAPVTILAIEGERPRIAVGRVLTRQYAPYAVGDRLWVRENLGVVSEGLEYCADSEMLLEFGAPNQPARAVEIWNHWGHEDGPDLHPTIVPSIFMPRWASRLTLDVSAVKIERVKDISEEDADAEGMVGPVDRENGWQTGLIPSRAFERLWKSINGDSAWEANPLVVALTFAVRRQNIDAVPA